MVIRSWTAQSGSETTALATWRNAPRLARLMPGRECLTAVRPGPRHIAERDGAVSRIEASGMQAASERWAPTAPGSLYTQFLH